MDRALRKTRKFPFIHFSAKFPNILYMKQVWNVSNNNQLHTRKTNLMDSQQPLNRWSPLLSKNDQMNYWIREKNEWINKLANKCIKEYMNKWFSQQEKKNVKIIRILARVTKTKLPANIPLSRKKWFLPVHLWSHFWHLAWAKVRPIWYRFLKYAKIG